MKDCDENSEASASNSDAWDTLARNPSKNQSRGCGRTATADPVNPSSQQVGISNGPGSNIMPTSPTLMTQNHIFHSMLALMMRKSPADPEDLTFWTGTTPQDPSQNSPSSRNQRQQQPQALQPWLSPHRARASGRHASTLGAANSLSTRIMQTMDSHIPRALRSYMIPALGPQVPQDGNSTYSGLFGARVHGEFGHVFSSNCVFQTLFSLWMPCYQGTSNATESQAELGHIGTLGTPGMSYWTS